ncbi:cellulose-growth-specific protein [Colletotrichum orchidophilum]|uniref:lytic cellulose monooxygenase (C4-dehydrogenating) n=1 Tax=Colletotrichum orchidophilum TaxID=1209926 RepID=A0A1G4BJ82_9PEZI|nr:cellulose-growth-specific protein [Colletotrichum orchidophilum]OHF01499.1 cellulose-growth-specific protein [Colletotrichum orchidophilum]
MKAIIPILTALVALSDFTSAHYRFTSLVVGGVNTGEYTYVRRNTNYNSPVTDVLSRDIVCNAGGLSSGPATQTATVAAGSTVGFAMDQAIYHDGPVIVWLSPAGASSNVTAYDGSGPWAKIWELGAQTGNGQIKFPAANQAAFNFAIPACTPPGEYLLRIEQIGLHSASAKAGAQFYISCAQIKVTGAGSGGSFSPTVRFPGAYTGNEPGILINIYYPVPTTYTVPGGPVAKC